MSEFYFMRLVVRGQAHQNSRAKEATFCGKVGDSGAAGQIYGVKELQDCDFKIIPRDSNLTVVEFQMSLVAKDNSYPYIEKKMTGNTISLQYKNQILTRTKSVFLEYIKAVNKNEQLELIKPITIRVN